MDPQWAFIGHKIPSEADVVNIWCSRGTVKGACCAPDNLTLFRVILYSGTQMRRPCPPAWSGISLSVSVITLQAVNLQGWV